MTERIVRLTLERRTFERTHVEVPLDEADYHAWRGAAPDSPELLETYFTGKLNADRLDQLTDSATWSAHAPHTRLCAAADAGEDDCVFCRIADGQEPATVLAEGISSIAIEPLNPVTPGHFIVIPREHVPDGFTAPGVTSQTMEDAARFASTMARSNPRYASVNFISSVGAPATQSVFHLHIHVVPRTVDDGLALPWYSGKRSGRSKPAPAPAPAGGPVQHIASLLVLPTGASGDDMANASRFALTVRSTVASGYYVTDGEYQLHHNGEFGLPDETTRPYYRWPTLEAAAAAASAVVDKVTVNGRSYAQWTAELAARGK